MERQSRQYGWILAAVLLMKACNPKDFRECKIEDPNATGLTREDVRAMAYVLGEKILIALSAKNSPPAS